MRHNIIKEKSYAFALQVIGLSRTMRERGADFYFIRQILKSGTSIGANIEEAIGGQSEKDFVAKMSIAYKEARETDYWIRLFIDSNIINRQEAGNLPSNSKELLKILSSIITTMKTKQDQC